MADDYDKVAELVRNGYSVDEALNQIAQSLADNSVSTAKIQDGAVTYDKLDSTTLKTVVQVARTDDGTYKTGTTIFPLDDTIPQSSEGVEFITVSITPKDTANTLIVEAIVNISHSAVQNVIGAALFKDAETGARAAAWAGRDNTGSTASQVALNYTMTAGTTSAITFKIRAGGSLAGTAYFNGAGTRYFGGVMNSYIQVTETL